MQGCSAPIADAAEGCAHIVDGEFVDVLAKPPRVLVGVLRHLVARCMLPELLQGQHGGAGVAGALGAQAHAHQRVQLRVVPCKRGRQPQMGGQAGSGLMWLLRAQGWGSATTSWQKLRTSQHLGRFVSTTDNALGKPLANSQQFLHFHLLPALVVWGQVLWVTSCSENPCEA
jgi:hypothetical protein